MSDPQEFDKRCGSCARFVRVIEKIDENGEVLRHGDACRGLALAAVRAQHVLAVREARNVHGEAAGRDALARLRRT